MDQLSMCVPAGVVVVMGAGVAGMLYGTGGGVAGPGEAAWPVLGVRRSSW